jgi:acyl carrier protein
MSPDTPVSVTVRRVWQRILSVADVQPSDNFFDLGGDSLSFVEMHETICQQFGAEIPLAPLLNAPDLKSFSGLLVDLLAAADET